MKTHNFHPQYRQDIDGLRALAILPVVAFHAFPHYAPGGFIGVDIFFVISGFLISMVIFRSLSQDYFSFSEFYARRIKRIFPALLLVSGACYVTGWFLLLPDEFEQLGKHVVAGMGFVENFVLLDEAGYFDIAIELKPLMHLWSLAIEEQFYLAFPFLVWGASRARLHIFTVICALALLSLAWNLASVDEDPIRTFFTPQTRFWELLAGSVLAYACGIKAWRPSLARCIRAPLLARRFFPGPSSDEERSARLSSLLSFLGLALIVFAIARYNHTMRYPGDRAIVPVLGAALLILAGPHAWVNRNLLSLRFMIWVGLISYPLYLWHWPLLSFARIVESETPSPGIRAAAVVISFILATLTFRLLERKVRYRRSNRTTIGTLLAIWIVIGCAGYYTYANDGVASRFATRDPELSEKIIKIAEAWKFRDYPVPPGMWKDPVHNLPGLGENRADLTLLLGDSHARQYVNTIDSFYEKGLISGKGTIFLRQEFPFGISEAILTDPRIKDVVFSFFWSYKYGSNTVDQPVRCCGPGRSGSIGLQTVPFSSPEEMVRMNSRLDAEIETLISHGKNVWIVLDNPFGVELDVRPSIKRHYFGKVEIAAPPPLSTIVARQRTEPVRSLLVELARRRGIGVIDPFDFLCNENTCPLFSDDGNLLYRDYDHISRYASRNHAEYMLGIYGAAHESP